MSGRPRHPRKDLEAILQGAEEQGWRVVKGSSYYKAYCPCGAHMKTVRLTPSNPNYAKNLIAWFHRCNCWKGGKG